MAEIFTTHGMLDEATLEKTSGFVDNDNEYTTWQEWRLGDELVKRDVQVRLKKAAVVASGEIGKF